MRSSWITAILLACALCFQSPIAADAQDEPSETTPIAQVDDARLDQALAAIEGDEGLQTQRPEWELPPFEPRERRSGNNAFLEWVANLFGSIGPALGYGLLAIIAAGLLYIAYLVFGDSIGLRRKQKPVKVMPQVSEVPDLRPGEEQAAALLEDADALAKQGRYAEAVHLLLFRSIEDIQDKRGQRVPRSLTAREITGLKGLPGRVRDALYPIVKLVERSFFGGRPVDENGWLEARRSYEAFAFGEAWI